MNLVTNLFKYLNICKCRNHLLIIDIHYPFNIIIKFFLSKEVHGGITNSKLCLCVVEDMRNQMKFCGDYRQKISTNSKIIIYLKK